MMRRFNLIGFALMCVMGVSSAHAQETATSSQRCKLDKNGGFIQRLKGTVEPKHDCSASLISVKGRPAAAGAWVMTNGHCIDEKTPDGAVALSVRDGAKVLYKFPFKTTFALDTGNAAQRRECVEVEEVVYATMKLTDLAIYRLALTYDEIEQRYGVEPLVLSSLTDIPLGMRVQVLSSFWQDVHTCETKAPVHRLKEYIFEWGPLMSLTPKCETMGGWSGAPVVREDTGEVIGVQGTVQESMGAPCSLNTPCEVTADGRSGLADLGTTYMHLAHIIYRCIDVNGDFDLMRPDCSLPKP